MKELMSERDQMRFWSKVALPNDQGCMLWTGKPNWQGYGRMDVRGRQIKAHRLSLFLSAGPPPTKKHETAHSCRNRICVSPLHLSWKTRKENSDDRERDGTVPRGERSGTTTLTAEQVRSMRRQYAAGGVRQIDLGKQFGVAQTTVSQIVTGKFWKEAGE